MGRISGGVLSDLGRFPSATLHSTHAWVDYLELLCLSSPSDRLSREDVVDLWSESEDLKVDDRSEKGDQDGTRGQISDERVALIDDWFRILDYRCQAFASYYPFKLSAHKDVIIRPADFSHRQKLYVFLLLCSCLPYISPGGHDHALTSSFEILSAEAMRGLLPPTAEVHIFGTSAPSARFSGNLWAKLNQLASELGAEVLAKENDFSKKSGQDGGLDIVAWVPLGDHNSGNLVLFGQCACTAEWTTKQGSVEPDTWRHKLHLKHQNCAVMFMPFCFRKSTGEWLVGHEVRTLLVDRSRFVRLIDKGMSSLKTSSAYAVVESALQERRSLY